MAASTTAKEPTTPPPPVIGKAGRYTVFLTPPSTPKPPQSPTSDSPKILPQTESPKIPPPVRPPPQQFARKPTPNSSPFGFFWNAVTRVQDRNFIQSMASFLIFFDLGLTYFVI
eukprot:TRINITY_DN4130_c1_g1_i1.p1 TRINITY_DN4130_c1_g1~~TRINITY_DN4130_c1_g1_i1.p1  ORF type:complete len:130 (-),score=26.68 TRINITY_DN4130_c1_g1_i1:588-929(-)